jgi:prepilin-type N-terminal cleavage/methylation domain-containing protein
MPRAAGFTVIELLFVAALIAVLLGIGAPALQTMVKTTASRPPRAT